MKAIQYSRGATRLAGALFMGAMALTAVAGEKDTHEVTFDAIKPFARGNLGDARNSTDALQYIGCSISGTAALCIAVNSAGVQHSCSTTDPDLMTAIRTIHGDSYLVFRYGIDGICTSVTVYNDSRFAPK